MHRRQEKRKLIEIRSQKEKFTAFFGFRRALISPNLLFFPADLSFLMHLPYEPAPKPNQPDNNSVEVETLNAKSIGTPTVNVGFSLLPNLLNRLPKIISFDSIARCGDEIWIENNGQIYRLRKTKQGKLILTK